MFAYIHGILVFLDSSQAILEVNGIGYTLFITSRSMTQFPPIGTMVKLHTVFIVREFAHTLYGFLTIEEKNVFHILTQVSGIGPKLALSLIDSLSLTELQEAVLDKNTTLLCKVPGVGKKTAERLLIELKDKLNAFPSEISSKSEASLFKYSIQDAILALSNLGYSQIAAKKAVEKSLTLSTEELDLPTLITTALRHI